MVKLANQQYNVPTTFQWVSCISILNKVMNSFLCNNYDKILLSPSVYWS